MLLAIAFLFSLHQICVRKGTLRADTLTGTLVSIGTTAVLFSIISAFITSRIKINELFNFLEFAIFAGILHFMLARAVFYQCISRVGANVAATLATTRILFSAILGYFLLGESVNAKTAVMALMVFAGVAILTFEVVSDLYGILAGITTGFLTALASVFAKESMLTNFTAPISEAVAGTAVGYVVALIFFYVFLKIYRGNVKFKIKDYTPFVAGGIFVGFGHFLRYLALFNYSVFTVETFVSVYPVFTYLLSGIFLRKSEVFSVRFFVSAILIFTGVELYFSSVWSSVLLPRLFP